MHLKRHEGEIEFEALVQENQVLCALRRFPLLFIEELNQRKRHSDGTVGESTDDEDAEMKGKKLYQCAV